MNKQNKGRPSTIWPPSRLKLLRKLYPVKSNEDVAIELNTTVRAIRSKAQALKLKKKGARWSDEDKQWLLNNYKLLSYSELGDHLGRGKWAIINQYRELKGLR